MFPKLFKRTQQISNPEVVEAVVTQTAALINDLQNRIELRFKELSAQVKEVELGLEQLETKLLTKDLKDKQAYGLLHYKLHEAKNTKLNEEIKELEEKLLFKKDALKDH